MFPPAHLQNGLFQNLRQMQSVKVVKERQGHLCDLKDGKDEKPQIIKDNEKTGDEAVVGLFKCAIRHRPERVVSVADHPGFRQRALRTQHVSEKRVGTIEQY